MKRRIHWPLLLGSFALITGCKKGNDNINTNACQLAGDKATAYSNAVKAFTNNKTLATCQAYKTAALAYVDAAATCVSISKADMDSIRKDINDTKC